MKLEKEGFYKWFNENFPNTELSSVQTYIIDKSLSKEPINMEKFPNASGRSTAIYLYQAYAFIQVAKKILNKPTAESPQSDNPQA